MRIERTNPDMRGPMRAFRTVQEAWAYCDQMNANQALSKGWYWEQQPIRIEQAN